MNFKANKTQWGPGSIVIHDADAKRKDMLMIVLDLWTTRSEEIMVRTAYLLQPKRSGKKGTWINRADVLHNPRRFGIELTDEDIRGFLVETLNRGKTN